MNSNLPLRDIHLPEAVGWWPPAPGWWILAITLLGLLVLLVHWYRKRSRGMRLYQSARSELQKIRQRYQQDQDTTHLIRELSILLRRVAISVSSREAAAGLTGEPWLLFLDDAADKPLFDSETGRQLLTAPYQPMSDANADKLLKISEQWLDLVSKQARKSHA